MHDLQHAIRKLRITNCRHWISLDVKKFETFSQTWKETNIFCTPSKRLLTRRRFRNLTNKIFYFELRRRVNLFSLLIKCHSAAWKQKRRRRNLLAQSQTFISKLHETQKKFLMKNIFCITKINIYPYWLNIHKVGAKESLKKINDTRSFAEKDFFFFFLHKFALNQFFSVTPKAKYLSKW